MAFRIITADERLAKKQKINIILLGPSGSGKTTQAKTLPEDKTLFVDLEGGDLAIQDWRGDTFNVLKVSQETGMHPWAVAKALAIYLSGPDPSDLTGDYSVASHKAVVDLFGGPGLFDKYEYVFFDSITVASRRCFTWCETQPEAFSEKTGKPDKRGAYGLLGREMMRWLTHIQVLCPKSVIMVGILDKHVDDLKRESWEPQIEGAKTGREMGGIFDQIVTLQTFKTDAGVPYRAFICTQMNQFGFPGKDRSGRLLEMEPPDLYALINKMRTGPRLDTAVVTAIPAA